MRRITTEALLLLGAAWWIWGQAGAYLTRARHLAAALRIGRAMLRAYGL